MKTAEFWRNHFEKTKAQQKQKIRDRARVSLLVILNCGQKGRARTARGCQHDNRQTDRQILGTWYSSHIAALFVHLCTLQKSCCTTDSNTCPPLFCSLSVIGDKSGDMGSSRLPMSNYPPLGVPQHCPDGITFRLRIKYVILVAFGILAVSCFSTFAFLPAEDTEKKRMGGLKIKVIVDNKLKVIISFHWSQWNCVKTTTQ